MPNNKEYEEALAIEREKVRILLKHNKAQWAAKELFGGTLEQQEETYKQLMGEDYGRVPRSED